MVIGSLVTNIVADLSKWGPNLNKARGQMGEFVRGISTMQAAIGGLVAGAAASFIKSTIEQAAALKDTAFRLNVNVEALQKYRFAADQMGSSAYSLDRALGFLNKTLGKAVGGNREAVDAFQGLGLSISQLSNQGLDKTFLDVIDAIRRLPSDSLQASTAAAILGKSSMDLLESIRAGSGEFEKYGQRLEHIGGVASQSAIAGLDELDDKLKELKASWDAFKIEAVSTGAGPVSMILKTAQKELSWWNWLLNLPGGLLRDAMGSTQYERAFGKPDAASPSRPFVRPLSVSTPRNPMFTSGQSLGSGGGGIGAFMQSGLSMMAAPNQNAVADNFKSAQRGLVAVLNMLPARIQVALTGNTLPGPLEGFFRRIGGLAAGFGGAVPAVVGAIGNQLRQGPRVGPLEALVGGTREATIASRENLRPRMNPTIEKVAKHAEKQTTLQEKMTGLLGDIAENVTGTIGMAIGG